jgi:hypothetical protein
MRSGSRALASTSERMLSAANLVEVGIVMQARRGDDGARDMLSCLSLRFSLLEPIAALTPITAHLSAHRALTDAQNAGDAFLADPALAQGINLTAILVRYSPVLPHRQPLAMSRGYPFIAPLNYALDS